MQIIIYIASQYAQQYSSYKVLPTPIRIQPRSLSVRDPLLTHTLVKWKGNVTTKKNIDSYITITVQVRKPTKSKAH